MRTFTVFLYFFSLCLLGKAQQGTVQFELSEKTLTAHPLEDRQHIVFITFSGTLSDNPFTVTVTDTRNGTARLGQDYSFQTQQYKLQKGSATKLPVLITVSRKASRGRILLELTTSNKRVKVTQRLIQLSIVPQKTGILETGDETAQPLARIKFASRESETILTESTTEKSVAIPIKLEGQINRPVTVSLTDSREGSASSTDYTIEPTPVTFHPDGPKEQTVHVSVRPTAANKHIVLQLKPMSDHQAVIENALMTLRIISKQPGSIQFSKRELTVEVSSETQIIDVPLLLNLGNSKLTIPVSVQIQDTEGGSAVAGNDKDYTFTSSEVTFSPNGIQAARIPISIHSTAQAGRTILLRLNTKSPIDLKDNLLSIRIIEKEVSFNPYRVSFGSNFNLLDGVALQRLYADAYVFLPNAFGVKRYSKYEQVKGNEYLRNTVARPWGLEAGMVSSRSFLVPSLMQDNTLRPSMRTFPKNANGEQLVERRTPIDTLNYAIDNTGFYFDVLSRITGSESNKTKVYGLFHSEVIRRVVNGNQVIERYRTTNVSSPEATIPNSTTVSQGKYLEQTFDGYFGFGMLIHHLSKDVEFRTKGAIAFGSLGSEIPLIQRGQSPWRATFFVNFALIERNTGIKLGGEVRGYMNPRNAPNISYIYLAKEFNLSKLFEFKLP